MKAFPMLDFHTACQLVLCVLLLAYPPLHAEEHDPSGFEIERIGAYEGNARGLIEVSAEHRVSRRNLLAGHAALWNEIAPTFDWTAAGIYVVTIDGTNRGMSSPGPLREGTFEEFVALHKRWTANQRDALPDDSPFVRSWLMRTALRLKASENAEPEVFQAILKQIAVSTYETERPLLIRLLRYGVVRTAMKQPILDAAANEPLAGASVASIAAWNHTLRALVEMPGDLDLDALEKTCARFHTWWDNPTLEKASLSDRALLTSSALALQTYATKTIPITRALRAQLNAQSAPKP